MHHNIINLTGKTFGKWLVLDIGISRKRGVNWLCRCECGTEKEIPGSALRSGESKNCGCVGNWRLIDIAGQVFGRLTVIKRAESRNNDSRAFWLCKCECGTEKVISGKHLRSGATVSCGCRMREVGKEGVIDLTGKVFTYLTVLNRSNPPRSKGNETMWDVLCECGNIKSVASASLIKGHTKSCGCWQANHPESQPNYIGGDKYYGYETTLKRIGYAEEVRKDPENVHAAQVKCSVCDTWFTPTRTEVAHRIAALEGYGKGDGRFYCSDECRTACSVFGQVKYPKGMAPDAIRIEVIDPQLNQMVLDRDGYACVKCGSGEDLNVHHIEGVAQSPVTANDIDNCITVCRECHKAIHSMPGCTYFDYQRELCLEEINYNQIST